MEINSLYELSGREDLRMGFIEAKGLLASYLCGMISEQDLDNAFSPYHELLDKRSKDGRCLFCAWSSKMRDDELSIYNDVWVVYRKI